MTVEPPTLPGAGDAAPRGTFAGHEPGMNRCVPGSNSGLGMVGDEHLIRKVADGDNRALRELFDLHAPWVAARLRRKMPAGAVEDALQETFIAVWRGAGRYEAKGPLGAWIWGIARRQAALWARKNGRPCLELDPFLAGEDPTAAVASRADLDRALAGLRCDEQRELARLVLVEDRPLREVARLLGIPEGTVKSRLYKLRKLLRTALVQGGT